MSLKANKKHLLMGVAALLLIASSSLVTFALTRSDKKQDERTATTTDSQNSDGNDTVVPEEKAIETKTVTLTFSWQDPVLVGVLPIFQDLESYYQTAFGGAEDPTVGSSYAAQHKYYLVGKTADGTKAYIATIPATGLEGEPVLFLLEKDGAFTLYQQHSTSIFYAEADGQPATYQGPKLTANVTINTGDIISEIDNKQEITYKGQKLANTGGFLSAMTFVPTPTPTSYDGSTTQYTKLADIAEGTLYEYVSISDPSYKITSFTLVYRNHMSASFTVHGELSKQQIDPITWNDGGRNSDDYASVGRGCGTSGANEVALGLNKDQLVQIGKSDKGQPIYSLKNPAADLMSKHYKEYKDADTPEYSMFQGDDAGLSLEHFVARKPIYLVEDSLGRWLVFSNMRYVPVGGCAKPVVYLYPEWPQRVDVSVGADVTVSDPFYPAGGWQNVLASPSGALRYKGTSYDSLFWEGYGHGTYPEITKGFVVARSDVVSTWEQHMRTMNLNEKEIADFTAFWSSRIPNKPYVRLSWLGTNDLQKLAPLYVSGGVDTMIRVFLDMEGLDTPIQTPAQNLVGIHRSGFTVVEWGGLVRDGSIPRMQ